MSGGHSQSDERPARDGRAGSVPGKATRDNRASGIKLTERPARDGRAGMNPQGCVFVRTGIATVCPVDKRSAANARPGKAGPE